MHGHFVARIDMQMLLSRVSLKLKDPITSFSKVVLGLGRSYTLEFTRCKAASRAICRVFNKFPFSIPLLHPSLLFLNLHLHREQIRDSF